MHGHSPSPYAYHDPTVSNLPTDHDQVKLGRVSWDSLTFLNCVVKPKTDVFFITITVYNRCLLFVESKNFHPGEPEHAAFGEKRLCQAAGSALGFLHIDLPPPLQTLAVPLDHLENLGVWMGLKSLTSKVACSSTF